MRKDITIVAEAREKLGKGHSGRLRVAGHSPGTVYGPGKDPISVTVSPKEINKVLHSASGHNTIFYLEVGGEKTPVMIVDWQNDPVKGKLLHVDLKRIDMDKRIRVKVPVRTHGEPKGVKTQGGIHDVITREIEIECLPDEIPEHFDVEVGELLIGQSIRASDLPMTGSMKLIAPPDTVISHVTSLRPEETAAPAAEGAAAATAEPEVIKKGKKEAEGEAPAGDKGGDKKAKK
jgi:large subunit ribosomal protein L25